MKLFQRLFGTATLLICAASVGAPASAKVVCEAERQAAMAAGNAYSGQFELGSEALSAFVRYRGNDAVWHPAMGKGSMRGVSTDYPNIDTNSQGLRVWAESLAHTIQSNQGSALYQQYGPENELTRCVVLAQANWLEHRGEAAGVSSTPNAKPPKSVPLGAATQLSDAAAYDKEQMALMDECFLARGLSVSQILQCHYFKADQTLKQLEKWRTRLGPFYEEKRASALKWRNETRANCEAVKKTKCPLIDPTTFASSRPAKSEAAPKATSATPITKAPPKTDNHQSDDQKVLAEMLRQDKEKRDQYRAERLAHIEAEASRDDAATTSVGKGEFNADTFPVIRIRNNTDIYLDFRYEYTIEVGGETRTGGWSGKLSPHGTDEYRPPIDQDGGKRWNAPVLGNVTWWADVWNYEGTWNQP